MTVNEVDDMCEPPTTELRHAMPQWDDFGENTWDRLNPEDIRKGLFGFGRWECASMRIGGKRWETQRRRSPRRNG